MGAEQFELALRKQVSSITERFAEPKHHFTYNILFASDDDLCPE